MRSAAVLPAVKGWAPDGVRLPEAPVQWPFGTAAPTDESAPQAWPQAPDISDIPQALW